MKKTLGQLAPYLAIIVLIGFMLFQSYQNRLETDRIIAANEKEMKRLDEEAKEKDARIVTLEFDKEELQKIIGSINNQLAQINKEKAILIKKRDEKINVISSYNSVQLQQFFSENYPE